MEKVLKKWLDHQCRMLQGSRRALLVTGKPRKGKFKRAIFWPDDNYDYAVFFRVAQVALRNKKTVIKTLRNQGKDSDQSLNVLACPIFLKRKLLGAVVIAMAYRSLSLQNAAVQQVQNGVKWLEAMLELPYDPLQVAKSKLFGLQRPSLQTAAGLAIILMVGLLLVSPLLRIPSTPKTGKVARRAIVTPLKINTAKVQTRLSDVADKAETVSITTAQNRHPEDARKGAGQSAGAGGSQHAQAVAMSDVDQDKTPSTAASEIKAEGSTAGSDSDTTTTPSEIEAKMHSIEIGPIIRASKLKQATQLLQTNGFEYQKTTGVGKVKAIRLLEGLYPRAEVQERLKDIQKKVASPFVLREKGGMAIYVATYYDRAKAEQEIKQLAKKGVQVTAVDVALKKKGTLLTIQKCTQANINTITDQMSEIGLSVEVSKSKNDKLI